MNELYYIHNPEYWDTEDLAEITRGLNREYTLDIKAARGEGAGGAGFDIVVELALPIATGLISAAIYDIVKLLVKNKPKNRPEAPEGVPSSYRLVVHTDEGIIGINLDSNIDEINIAIENLPDLSESETSRAYQNGKHWDIF